MRKNSREFNLRTQYFDGRTALIDTTDQLCMWIVEVKVEEGGEKRVISGTSRVRLWQKPEIVPQKHVTLEDYSTE